ncbi:MAG: ATP synthase F1 subunit delta [Planctomycetota bacterium]|jgi:F-type H+-transporting ATPase subunit delta
MASDLDISLAAADIYAQALLELANERDVVDDLFEEFLSLVEYIESDDEFRGFMASFAVDDDDRREVLRRAFSGRISEMLLNLMLVLNDHNRAGIVKLVFERYKKLYDEQSNREDVEVTSAVPLTDDERAAIEAEVTGFTGKQSMLVEEVDPSILGGLIVQVGDRQFDGSLRTKLVRMREFVIERGRQEILSGKHDFWSE